MASGKDLPKILIQERDYLEIDAKVKFYAVVSSIIKWQIAASEVSDDVYKFNKEQYITEAGSLQSKLTEAYLRLDSSTVYKVSSSEKKKKEILIEELSYDINYLSDITPMETDCNQSAAPPTTKEQVDADELSTVLHDIHVEHTDQKVTAIDLTDQNSEHVEPTITEVENANETCRGHAIADTVHTVIVTEETDAHAEETDTHPEETDAHIEETNAHTEESDVPKKETGAHTEKTDAHTTQTDVHTQETDAHTEESDVINKETDTHTEEPDVHKEIFGEYTEETEVYKEPAVCTEYTEQPPRAWPTTKPSTSTNSQAAVM